jgi:hypothetical protein
MKAQMPGGGLQRARSKQRAVFRARRCSAAILLLAALTLAPSHSARAESRSSALSSKRESSAQPASAKKAQAKSKAEFDAYQAAASETDPAKLEAAATNFAQRYPSSTLRPFLFQRAMGLYQQANIPAKALEMARAVLKYDATNPVALLGAAQILAEHTHNDDLDHDARLQEAGADAQSALQHAGDLLRPANLTTDQFSESVVELRGAAHEVLATVAYKQHDYRKAIDEYNAAIAAEKNHVDAVVWLRLAAAHDKTGEYSLGIDAVQKAIAATEPGSPVRELAERESARLKTLAATAATQPAAKQPDAARAPAARE